PATPTRSSSAVSEPVAAASTGVVPAPASASTGVVVVSAVVVVAALVVVALVAGAAPVEDSPELPHAAETAARTALRTPSNASGRIASTYSARRRSQPVTIPT